MSAALLLSEAAFHSAELAGLDQPVELLAVDLDRCWGHYWQAHGLEPHPPLGPEAESLPEEGGYFLLRPLGHKLGLSWQTSLESRQLHVPSKSVHRELGLPAVSLISNRVFVELRFSLPPSLVATFDFDELRDGVYRAFVLPVIDDPCLFRLFLVLDEFAAEDTLSDADGMRRGARERLERFLSSAVVSPPSARWASTLDSSMSTEQSVDFRHAQMPAGGLFVGQCESVRWCESVEGATDDSAIVRVVPMTVGGRQFGAEYDVALPAGGCIAHPPGAGKSRIVAALVSRSSLPTLLLCPGHLLPLWRSEFEAIGRKEPPPTALSHPSLGLLAWVWSGQLIIAGFHALHFVELAPEPPEQRGSSFQGEVRLIGHVLPTCRLVVDEPQDAPSASIVALLELASAFKHRWAVCGTADAHLSTIGPLICGPRRWREVTTLDEWRGTPSLAHLFRRRFLRDPAWACLPPPPLQMKDVIVQLSQAEAMAAQIAKVAARERRLLHRMHQRHWRRIESERIAQSAGPLPMVFVPLLPEQVLSVAAQSETDGISADVAGAVGGVGSDASAGEARKQSELEKSDAIAEEPTVESSEVSPTMEARLVSSADEAQLATPAIDGTLHWWGSELGEEEEDDDDEEESVPSAEDGPIQLAEWDLVEKRCRSRLARTEARLADISAEMLRQAREFALSEEAPSGILQRLHFLFDTTRDPQQQALPVELKLKLHEEEWTEVEPHLIGNAEWNASFSSEHVPRVGVVRTIPGMEHREISEPSHPSVIFLATLPVNGDVAAEAWRAHRLGGSGILFQCEEELTRPMSYPSHSTPPPLPAAMIPESVALKLHMAIAEGRLPWASLKIADMTLVEDVSGGGGGVDEGKMAQVVALEDGLDSSLALAVSALHEKRDQLKRALRFAASAREGIAESDAEVTCPVCLDSELSALSVLPECFHTLCASCLQRTAAGLSTFRCPLCRIQVELWTVSVFRRERHLDEHKRPPPCGISLPNISWWNQLPSKLCQLIELVHNLLDEASDERVLVFTQWLSHVEYIAACLAQVGIPALTMSNDLSHSMRSLNLFGKQGEPQVLLLSSQYHASGVNLQMARNLIIVHPCEPHHKSNQYNTRTWRCNVNGLSAASTPSVPCRLQIALQAHPVRKQSHIRLFELTSSRRSAASDASLKPNLVGFTDCWRRDQLRKVFTQDSTQKMCLADAIQPITITVSSSPEGPSTANVLCSNGNADCSFYTAHACAFPMLRRPL